MMDRFKESIANAIKALLPPLDYLYAHYPAKVIQQDADFTLQVRPDNPNLPDMIGVPIRYGIPGARATVQPNTRVLVSFEAGDPRKPIAHLWETQQATIKLELTANEIVLNGGALKVARDTDPVNAGTLTATVAVAPGPVTFIYTPAGGVPGPPLLSASLTGGKITNGSPGVKA